VSPRPPRGGQDPGAGRCIRVNPAMDR
jgi:hypothetical protein